MSAREKDQADFDLERFIDMFDEALTSDDPRVINALRSLMMIVTLTRPESYSNAIDSNTGPLRRLFEDLRHLNSRVGRMEDDFRSLQHNLQRNYPEQARPEYYKYPYEKYSMDIAAAGQLASQADHEEILNRIRGQHSTQIKGLLDK